VKTTSQADDCSAEGASCFPIQPMLETEFMDATAARSVVGHSGAAKPAFEMPIIDVSDEAFVVSTPSAQPGPKQPLARLVTQDFT